MGGRHQIGFGRRLVGRMAPVGIRERPELSAIDKSLQALLYLFEIGRAAHLRIADVVGELRGFERIGFQSADDIDPVQRISAGGSSQPGGRAGTAPP